MSLGALRLRIKAGDIGSSLQEVEICAGARVRNDGEPRFPEPLL